MLLLIAFFIGFLAFLNYKYSKELFHPAVVFCSFWAFDLIVLWAADNLFYQVHFLSLASFLCGATLFSIGAFSASLKKTKPLPKISATASNRLITIAVWVIVLSVPVYVRWILSLVADRGGAQTFLMATRVSLIEIQGTGMASTLFGGIMLSSIVIAMVAFREREGHGKRVQVAIAAAMVICVLTATKGAPVWLIFGLLFLHWLKTRRLKLKVALVTLLVLSTIVFSVEFSVHINGNSFKESAIPVLENVALYISSGLVAFDQVVENPTVIPGIANPPYDTLKRIANRFFGTNLELAPTIPAYIFVGPHDFRGNTYTMYASWWIFGLAGSVLMMLPIGYFTGRIYYRALAGGACSSILYGLFISGLAFSPLTDYLSSLSMMVIFSGVSWCLFYLPGRFRQFRAFLNEALHPARTSRDVNDAKIVVRTTKLRSRFFLLYRHWRSSLHQSVQDGFRERNGFKFYD